MNETRQSISKIAKPRQKGALLIKLALLVSTSEGSKLEITWYENT